MPRKLRKGDQRCRNSISDCGHSMTNEPEVPMVQRTKAALQSAEGKTINTWKYGKDGIVLYFLDGTNLEIDITYDREIVGVQNEPYLMAHFGGKGVDSSR